MKSRVVIVFAGTLLLYVAAVQVFGANKAVEGDSAQYLEVARSIAAGNGYKNPAGPWPNEPACDRMPVWPLIISAGLRVLPFVQPEAVSRYMAALCAAAAAGAFVMLGASLGLSLPLAAAAGFTLALSPILIFLAVSPLSEASFVMLAAWGVYLFLREGRKPYAGAVLFGLAALVRSNFIAVPLLCALLALAIPAGRAAILRRWKWPRLLALLAICYAPAALWVGRNYQVTGRFPLLSTIEGETLYGANNERVANDLDVWGYWIMPDAIPGETPKLQLARRLGSDLALNDYYIQQSKRWTREHPGAQPRLLLGKWIRAYVPLPWRPLLESYVSYSYRVALILALLSLARFWWPAADRGYLLFLLAMFIANSMTAAVFYGSSRFTHCFVEVFTIPCVFLGYQEWRRARTGLGGKAPIPLAAR